MSHDTALLVTNVRVSVNLYKYIFTFLMCTWTCIGQCCDQQRHFTILFRRLPHVQPITSAVEKDSASKTDTASKHSSEQNLTSLRTRLVFTILRTHTRTCTPKAALHKSSGITAKSLRQQCKSFPKITSSRTNSQQSRQPRRLRLNILTPFLASEIYKHAALSACTKPLAYALPSAFIQRKSRISYSTL